MRVLVADDRPEVRSALRLLLEQDTDIVVAGEAPRIENFLAQVQAACPDLVLLDWDLPGLQPSDLLPALRWQCPCLLLVALGSRREDERSALSAGADAFISKTDSPERLLPALKYHLGWRPIWREARSRSQHA